MSKVATILSPHHIRCLESNFRSQKPLKTITYFSSYCYRPKRLKEGLAGQLPRPRKYIHFFDTSLNSDIKVSSILFTSFQKILSLKTTRGLYSPKNLFVSPRHFRIFFRTALGFLTPHAQHHSRFIRKSALNFVAQYFQRSFVGETSGRLVLSQKYCLGVGTQLLMELHRSITADFAHRPPPSKVQQPKEAAHIQHHPIYEILTSRSFSLCSWCEDSHAIGSRL